MLCVTSIWVGICATLVPKLITFCQFGLWTQKWVTLVVKLTLVFKDSSWTKWKFSHLNLSSSCLSFSIHGSNWPMFDLSLGTKLNKDSQLRINFVLTLDFLWISFQFRNLKRLNLMNGWWIDLGNRSLINIKASTENLIILWTELCHEEIHFKNDNNLSFYFLFFV